MTETVMAVAGVVGLAAFGVTALVVGWSMGYDYGKRMTSARYDRLADTAADLAAENYELKARLVAYEWAVDEVAR